MPGSETFASAAEDWLFGDHPSCLPGYAVWLGTPPKPELEAARERAGITFLRHLQRWLPIVMFALFSITMMIGGFATGEVLICAAIGVIGGAAAAGVTTLIFRQTMPRR